jgi:protein TonB
MTYPRIFICLTLLFCSLQRASAQSTAPEPKDSAIADTDHLPKTGRITRDDSVFTAVEIEASFPGGKGSWLRYLNTQLRYPKEAIRQKIEGTVTVQFTIGTDGRVTDVSGISGPDLLQQEVIEIVKASPKWNVASQNGRAVKSFKKQSLSFRLPGVRS